MSKIHLSYCLIIGVLVALLYLSIAKDKQETVVEKSVTDTLVVYKTEKIVEYQPKYITKKITDTLYLPNDSNRENPIMVEQKHYKTDSIYDAWVSGYMVSLDSIKTYPKIEYRTITNTITKELEISRIDIYPYMGFNAFNGNIMPIIGLSIKTPKKALYMGEIGTIDGKMYYGLKIGFMLK